MSSLFKSASARALLREIAGSQPLVSLAESRGSVRPIGPRSAPPTLDKHLRDYLKVLVKRRYTVLAGLAAIVVLALIHLHTAVPIYETAVQILIEHEKPATFSLTDSTSQDRETTDYYHTQYTILESRTLAKRSIDDLVAWDNAELNGRLGPAEMRPTGVFEGVLGWVTSSLARLKGLKPVLKPVKGDPKTPAAGQPTMPTAAETPAQAAVIDAFISRLTIDPVKTSRLVDVKFRAADPKFAAAAANALARAYIDQNLEVRMTTSKETSDWLTQQLGEQRQRIQTSEEALQRYRESHDAVSLADRQSMVVQKLTDLNTMVTRAKADRIGREALYNQVLAIQKREAPLDTLPSILSNSYLQQLKADRSRLEAQYGQLSQDLGDANPQIIKLKASIADADAALQRELAKQVEAMKNEFEAARTLEMSLTQALDSQKHEALTLNRTGIDYNVLDREVTTNRQIFDSLLERTREKGIAGELKASDVRVIDAAQPPRLPMWPLRTETLLYAGFFGSLFGVGLAFFFEYMDDRIKTPDEIRTYLGLPFLGLLPLIAPKDPEHGTPLLHQGVSPLFAESFRALRTNVMFCAEQNAHSLVVTSTGPGEGKTVVASNLAIGLAMTGRKVLLLDVDMRRPRVHDVFGVSREPGLSEVLSGTADASHVMQDVAVRGLRVITSGGYPENPAELLSSPQFSHLLAEMADQFEWIIIDSPPVAVVTDAAIVANRAGAVIFVVGSELTSRASAIHALEQLDTASANFVGAVLNRVKLKRDAFFYSSYYRPSYNRYHQVPPASHAQEPVPAATRRSAIS